MDLLPVTPQPGESVPRAWVLTGQLAGLLTASVALGWLALAMAPGVQPNSAPDDTRFVHFGVWISTLVLAVPLWFFGRWWKSMLLCLFAVVLVAVPQFWVFAVEVDRIEKSGFSQGLEILGITIPMLLGSCFIGAALMGRHEGLARR
jgi:hypothetical protein